MRVRGGAVLVGIVGVIALLETPVILVGPVVVIAAVVWLAARGGAATKRTSSSTAEPAQPIIVPPAGRGSIVDRMVAELDSQLGR